MIQSWHHGQAGAEQPTPQFSRLAASVAPFRIGARHSPFCQFRAFLHKAMQVAHNLVFVGLAPAWFVRARQEDMRQARFALVELCALPIPPDWPQFGIELTAGWARRGWQGGIAHTRLLEESPGR